MNITPQQARDWLASGEAVLIDVREPDEFKAEHIPQALSFPLSCLGDNLAQLAFPPGRKMIFQCQRGRRGAQACALAKDGFNIEGGIEAWKAAGFPVISSGGAKISIFRQVQITVGALVLLATLSGFHAVAGLLGAALLLSGITGWCGLALLLTKAPWNKK